MGASNRVDIVTPPSSYPVTLSEVKDHLGVSTNDDDSRIMRMIAAATDNIETLTGRKLITQTWNWYLDDFVDEMTVPFPPLKSVSAITYIDTSGNEQTLASSVYTVDKYPSKGRIVLAYNQTWPSTRDIINAVTVTFICGYGKREDVPNKIQSAILLDVEMAYDRAEDKYMKMLQDRRDSLILQARAAW